MLNCSIKISRLMLCFNVFKVGSTKVFETMQKVAASREKWGIFGAMMGQIKQVIMDV